MRIESGDNVPSWLKARYVRHSLNPGVDASSLQEVNACKELGTGLGI